MIKTCAFCDQKFTALRSTAKFCSPACKLKFNRGHETKKQNPQTPPVMPTGEEVVKIAEKVLAKNIEMVEIKVGNPPGSRGTIKVPKHWTLEDIDKALMLIDT